MTSEMKYMYELIKHLCMQYFSKQQQSCYQVFAGKATENHLHELALTVMILSFRTDRPGQTVKTQIRQLLEQKVWSGLHCLPFPRSHIVQILG